ncbi:MAG TPA: PaaI family thioesterase [Solirubrobacteraceae bacterium]|jgi:1,4-dihydroxy-2-naphthoyl-CoA hydrolase|nr:PaaI family thioesterase [Solirubrobacteraceae bacterium]
MDSSAMGAQLTDASEFMRLLEIEFDERSPTRVTGSVAADERHHQPWGLVHGGLYTTVVETFATTGAFEAIKDRGQQAVGVSNTTDFVRPHTRGRLDVVAIPIHQGRTQQLWQVEIRRPEDNKLVARGQVRLQNIETNG